MQVSLIIKVPLPVLKVLPNKQIRGVHIGSVAARWHVHRLYVHRTMLGACLKRASCCAYCCLKSGSLGSSHLAASEFLLPPSTCSALDGPDVTWLRRTSE